MARDKAREESKLKYRLATKVALVAQDEKIPVTTIARKAELDMQTVLKILDGDVGSIDLFDIVLCLSAVGQDLQLSTAKSSEEDGRIFFELDDAA